MSDFSSDEFLKGKSYWTFLPSSNRVQTAPVIYHLSGNLFESIKNDGAIRICAENSILILEHATFTSITSNQNGGCVLFFPGHSVYQKDICARNVYSSTKSNYGFINISQTSENINYISMISIVDCITTPRTSDMIWIGGGKASTSYYNSTNNNIYNSPGFYLGYSVGRATASFLNVLLGVAEFNAIICSDSVCLIQNSNFYKDSVGEASQSFLCLLKDTSVVDHCVFAQNTANNFLLKRLSVTYCSFDKNSFGSVPNSSPYTGSYSFVVNTQCHMWKHNDCIKNYSCVSRYSTVNSFMFSFFIFILLI